MIKKMLGVALLCLGNSCWLMGMYEPSVKRCLDAVVNRKYDLAMQLYKQGGFTVNQGLSLCLWKPYAACFFVLNGAQLNIALGKTKNATYSIVVERLYDALVALKTDQATGIWGESMSDKIWNFLLFASCKDGLPLQTQDEFEQNFITLKNRVSEFEVLAPEAILSYLRTKDRASECIRRLNVLCETLKDIVLKNKNECIEIPLPDFFTQLTDVMIVLDADFVYPILIDERKIRNSCANYQRHFQNICKDWEIIKALRVQ